MAQLDKLKKSKEVIQAEVKFYHREDGSFTLKSNYGKLTLPRDEFASGSVYFPQQMVGQTIPVIVIDDQDKKVSYRRALQKNAGTPGLVRIVATRQIYIETSTKLAEVERRQATKSAVLPLHEIYQPGDIVELNEDNEVILPDPWESGAPFSRGDYVMGTVINTYTNKQGSDYALIEIEPGLVGITDLPFRGDVSRYDKVNCFVQNVNPDKKRLKLSMRKIV